MTAREDLIRGALEAWNRRDLEALAPALAPDFEWVENDHHPADVVGDRRGTAAIDRVTADLEEGWEDYRAEITEYLEVDEATALVIMTERARGSVSGIELETTFGYVISVKDGKLGRVVVHRDPEAARRAAGGG